MKGGGGVWVYVWDPGGRGVYSQGRVYVVVMMKVRRGHGTDKR